MGFKDLVAKLDNVLGDHDKGKSLKLEKLKNLEEALEKKREKYLEQLRQNSGASEETPAQTEVRLRVVEAQLAKLRELMEEASL